MIQVWETYYNHGWADEQRLFCARYGESGPIAVAMCPIDAAAQAFANAAAGGVW